MRAFLATAALISAASAHDILASRVGAAAATSAASPGAGPLVGVVPPNTLTHFCVVTGYAQFNQTLETYARFLGLPVPTQDVSGGPGSNGTYMGKRLTGSTKIAFISLNNGTQMEFLAGDAQPSWWRDVYLQKGYEVHHMGYALPRGNQIWTTVQAMVSAGLGTVVQSGRWGTINTQGAGCYVYLDTQSSLGVTVEILASETDFDSMPLPPPS